MSKRKEELKKTTNNHLDRIRLFRDKKNKLNCIYCPPGKGENASQQPKHGSQKPRKRIRRKK